MDTINNVYVKALSNGEWFGGWAPVDARLGLQPDGEVGLSTLVEEGLDEDDEYEYYQQGSMLITVRDGEEYKYKVGWMRMCFRHSYMSSKLTRSLPPPLMPNDWAYIGLLLPGTWKHYGKMNFCPMRSSGNIIYTSTSH